MSSDVRIATLVAVSLFAVFVFPWQGLLVAGSSWVPQGLYSRDTLGNRLVAANLARGDGFDLAPYFSGRPVDPLLREQMLFPGVDGAMIPRFPVLTGLMAAPFFVGAAAPDAPSLAGLTATLRGLPQRELYAAAALTTVATLIMLLLVRAAVPAGSPRWLAPGVAVGFALGSPWWSANSQALWSHTGSSLWIALFLSFTWGRSQLSWRRAALAGVLLALAAWCRPSHLVSMAVVACVLLADARERRCLPAFCAAGAAGLGLMAISHLALYGDPLGPYIRQLLGLGLGKEAVAGGATHAGLPAALAGMLLSPSAGLLVFCPWVLLAFKPWTTVWRQGWWGRSALLIVVIQTLLIARNPLWWGGWCYGPRLFADILPFLVPALVVWLIPAPLADTTSPRPPRLAPRRIALLGMLFLWSMAMQLPGAALYRFSWHVLGDDLAQAPWRLWSVNEGIVLQTLRDRHPLLSDELFDDRELWSLSSLEVSASVARYPCDPSHDLYLLITGAMPTSQCQWMHLSGAPVWLPMPATPPSARSLELVLQGPLSERAPIAVDAMGQRVQMQRQAPSTRTAASHWRLPPTAVLQQPVFVKLGDLPVPITSPLGTIPEIRLSPAPEWHVTE